MIINVDDLTKLSIDDGLSNKNTILTYKLADWQLKLLRERIEGVTNKD